MAKKKSNGIFEKAKLLRQEYPNRFDTWQEYVAQATAIYHRKKGDSMPRKKPVKKQSSRVTGKSHTPKRKSKGSTIGKITFHRRQQKTLLSDYVGELEARKMRATTKPEKRKIQKQITEAKRDYNKLK